MPRPGIEIDGRKIGSVHPPYVIAEISGNHNGSIENALKLITVAKQAGADAVKLQTYTADTLTIDCDLADFRINEGLWAGKTLYQLYEWAHTPWEWHKQLFDHARQSGITLFSSPFDTTAVDFLEELGAPAYKIASFEAVDLPLIEYTARTGKPMIISTGMADQDEIQAAIETARTAGCSQLAILHCVSGYPAPAEEYNLHTIRDMMDRYGLVTGLSDHTLDNTTAIAATALGASIIEKHITLDRQGGGPDDAFSLEPEGLHALCDNVRTAFNALGTAGYARTASEEKNTLFRRSLYAVQDIREGEMITKNNVRSIRPGFGLPPRYLDIIQGRVAIRHINRGEPILPDCFDSDD